MQAICTTPKPRQELSQVRDYISYSAVNTFQRCPLQYFFRYVAGLPEEFVSASLVFGRAMHAAVQFHFEQLLMKSEAPGLDVLLDVFQRAWKETAVGQVRYGIGEDYNALCKLADRMLWTFLESGFAYPEGTIIGVEEELRGTLSPGLPDLLARVDLIVETADALIVDDFKTARRAWGQDEIFTASTQLLLYSKLVHRLADGKPIQLQYSVLTKTKAPELNVHPISSAPEEVERTKTMVERVWAAIQAGHFYPNPSPMHCSTCPYRRACQRWRG
jgi:putative RecB family exonuclease